VFVVGCGHSGTSLLVRILGHHSRLYGIPVETGVFRTHELRAYYWAPRRMFRVWWNREKLLADFALQCRRAGKTRWVEKTPSHVRHIRRILAEFPEARVVFMVRDLRDVACSLQARNGSLEKALRRVRADNLAGLQWTVDQRVRMTRYEDLVVRGQDEIAELLQFLGEAPEPLLERFNQARARASAAQIAADPRTQHHQLRMQQVSLPLFDGRGRWRREMSAEMAARFDAICGDVLHRLGYGSSAN
jgi:hypothetical protein